MKGLFIKDSLVIWSQAKYMLVLVTLYTVMGAWMDNANFWVTFAGLMVTTLPITVLGLDERSRWDQYAQMLPYSKKEMVFSKYALGLAGILALAICFSIASVTAWIVKGNSWSISELAANILLMCSGGVIFLSINLPMMFRFGVEKGRMWFLATIVLFAACAGAFGEIFLKNSQSDLSAVNNVLAVGEGSLTVGITMLFIGIVVLLVSVSLSAKFYEKRLI